MTTTAQTLKTLYEIGEAPPLGHVPPQMHAQVIRQSRFGQPRQAFEAEVVDTPAIGPDDALVYVMAAGVNYNNVWAGLGVPLDVIASRNKAGDPDNFHIGGSDASGIVYQVGANVTNVKVGDEVVIHCGTWDVRSPDVLDGQDPMFSPSFKIWGYETSYGSFAQFTRVQAHQCMPRAKHLTWEASAAPTLVGSTAYRMLFGWPPHTVREGDPVLIWGGAGGLGSMAIQLVAQAGGRAIAVVSNEAKFDYCMKLGAVGCINRKKFDHWSRLPNWENADEMNAFTASARGFGKAIWDVLGERKSPRIVFEHPGQDTVPTSIFVCDTAGMVVICAGTTGYNADVDLRYLWMRQKRLQGSHFANDAESAAYNAMVTSGEVDPCLSTTHPFTEVGLAHQLMRENRHPMGNMSILVGARDAQQRD
ncbi:MAG TPA: crotonyl-CoA carboxylase/reductase [Candidatus Saccharimonadales bacterium]|nr:crotonyl-CoA carboxylase/reductase [Candidatus Saccharimonadales bacterium]